MTETVPDGPTDPRFTMAHPDEHTTIIPQHGYGGPPAPPVPSAPPAPLEPASGGRVYGTGDSGYPLSPEPAAPEPALEEPGPEEPGPDRGRTTIADEVVERMIERIVDLAADEVPGVYALHPGAGPDSDRPVSVRLDDGRAVIDIAIKVEFGHPVHEVVDGVRSRVISQSERLLGLSVPEVNVLVAEVIFDPQAGDRSLL
jgi:uncharacterized alkaline shock family protein YloU